MTTAKRSRGCCGSSFSIIDVDSPPSLPPSVAAVKLPNSPNKYMRPSPEAVAIPPLCPEIPVNAQLPMAGFLDTCHFCRKRIPPLSEIFMYRDFCAFCSKECRDNQIKCNGLPEEQSILKPSLESKKNLNGVSK